MNNTVDIKKYAASFNRARNNLLGVIGLTLLNVVLVLFNVNLHFFFSAVVPSVFAGLFPGVVGIVLALVSIGIYIVFWALSKKHRVFLLVAFVVFAIDTLVLLFLVILAAGFGEFDVQMLINLAFHGWVWYYLILGTMAWVRLRNVTPEQAQAALDVVEQETANTEAKSTLETMTTGSNQDSQTMQDDRYEYYGSSDENNNNENN